MRPCTIVTTYRGLAGDIFSIRKVILAALLIFLTGTVSGILYQDSFSGMMESFAAMARGFTAHSGLSLIIMIFLRNAFSSALSIALGFFLGIFPVLGALANGLIVGLVMSRIESSERITALLLLIPHGIFELPAMFISWGLGIWKGITPFATVAGMPFQETQVRPWKIYFLVIVPLLLIAAVIEGTMIGAMRGR